MSLKSGGEIPQNDFLWIENFPHQTLIDSLFIDFYFVKV